MITNLTTTVSHARVLDQIIVAYVEIIAIMIT